jgi:1-acyl-sn-glycerol-3-phosphate acyltransferase
VTGQALARRFAERLMARALARKFRRVVWLGPLPALPEAPVVLYANHHYFHDGYLLWHLAYRHLGRPPVLWMEAWDAVPLFGPAGALPFPADDTRRRTATVRETVRRMTAAPRTVLLLYPEGVLGPPDAGLAPFRADLARLARVLPSATRWWPVALRVTWWGDERPSALLTGGPVHDAPDGGERERLAALLERLTAARPDDLAAGRARVLLDGGRDPHARWDLSRLAPLFRRWT